ncbi:hypothetical protein [Nocardioides bruguierae]
MAGASVYSHDNHFAWELPASSGRDVGGFNNAASSVTWDVTAPSTGDYRLSVLSGANQAPGVHALFVDGELATLVHYGANLGWSYRGTALVDLPLTAGQHTLSLRASRNGTDVLPGADITLDRMDLYDVTAGEQATYPATDARLSGGANLDWADPATAGTARLADGGTATFYTANAGAGYQDLALRYATTGGSDVTVTLDGRVVHRASPERAGTWTTTVRAWLSEGVHEVQVSSDAGVLLDDLTTLRGPDQVAADADTADVLALEAEDLQAAGNAHASTIPANVGSNGSADASGAVTKVVDVGNGPGNTLTLTRPTALGADDYVLTFGYANAERVSGINYNPQVVSRFLDVDEVGGSSTRVPFRHNYSWSSFWDTSVPVTLTTVGGDLVLGNDEAYGPDLDTVTLARAVVATSTVREPTPLGVRLEAGRVTGERVTYRVALTGDGAEDATVTVASAGDPVLQQQPLQPRGEGRSRTLALVPRGEDAGTAALRVTAVLDDQTVREVVQVHVGGPGADVLTGTEGPDVLLGRAGADVLRGGGGDDVLVGGDGPDDLAAGRGDDLLAGGGDVDDLAGGPGADRFVGPRAQDVWADLETAEGDRVV